MAHASQLSTARHLVVHAVSLRGQPIIIIINSLQATAGHRLLQRFAVSLDLRLLASSCCQLFCANRPSWPEGILHNIYRNAVSTPELVYPSASTADTVSQLPLQRANTVCYVGDFSFLPDHLVSDSMPQRNPGMAISMAR
jgi:hypothetical protein